MHVLFWDVANSRVCIFCRVENNTTQLDQIHLISTNTWNNICKVKYYNESQTLKKNKQQQQQQLLQQQTAKWVILSSSQPRFSCSKNQRVHYAPQQKPATLLRIHSSKVFSESLSKNESLNNFGFRGNPGLHVEVVHIIRFLTGNPNSKMKILVPLVESQQK